MVVRLFSRIHCLNSTFCKIKSFKTSAAALKTVQFNLSDIGEGIREVTVREWFVGVGDVVAQFDNICLVESDKASVSITSRYDGKILKLYYQIGEVAKVGKPLVDIEVEGNDYVSTSSSPEPEYSQAKSQSPEKVQSSGSSTPKIEEIGRHEDNEVELDPHFRNKTLATPAVRRIAKENNILLSAVKATGKGGRVLKEDILNHIETQSKQPLKMPTEGSRIEKIDGIRKAMVKSMTLSHSIPIFSYCDEVNVTKLVELRENVKDFSKKKGLNFSFMPFFVKAISKALEQYPILNASVDENCENVIYKSNHNVGIAMDTKGGLIVPNIKNVEELSISEIAVELNRLVTDGRDLKLSPKDMTGGTITISNIGIIGGTYTKPLILPPEVCIVGLGKVRLVPTVSDDGEIVKIYQLVASWSADHRIIDGVTMAKFSNTWKEYVENPNYLLLNL